MSHRHHFRSTRLAQREFRMSNGYPNDPDPRFRNPPPPVPPGGDYAYDSPEWPERPATHLVLSILVTCFCCLPLGVVGIVYAAQVESRYNARDFSGAANASQKAKNFSLAGLAAGGIIVVVYVAIALLTLTRLERH